MALLSASAGPFRSRVRTVRTWSRDLFTIPATFHCCGALEATSIIQRKHLYHHRLSLTRLLSSNKPPRGFEKFFPKSEASTGVNKSVEAENPKEQEPAGNGSNDDDGEKRRGGKKEESHWWTKFQEDFPLDKTVMQNVAIGAAGMASAFLYLHFRETGLQILWKDFVHHYLSRGLVDHLEVVNKQYVKVYPSPGVNASDVSYLWFNIGSVDSFEHNLKMAQEEIGLNSPHKLPVFYTTQADGALLATVLPSILFLGLLFFTLRQGPMAGGRGGSGQANPFSMGKSKAKIIKDNIGVHFKDVAGCEEAKLEIMEFVNFLKNPSQYHGLGAKIPKGALLSGPPGNGKTMLAKATAGEANVPFITISGSEFQEVFVGVGPARVSTQLQYHSAQESWS